MELSKFIKKIIIIMSVLFCVPFSCCVGNYTFDDQYEHPVGVSLAAKNIMVTDEEIETARQAGCNNYKEILEKAYMGDILAMKNLLNLVVGGSWDGAASDALSSNLQTIIYKWSDSKFRNFLEENISSNDFACIKSAIFLADDTGSPAAIYVRSFSETYALLEEDGAKLKVKSRR